MNLQNLDVEDFKRMEIRFGDYISRYFSLWSKPATCKISLTTELDVAYGYADRPGILKGLLLERFVSPKYFQERQKDINLSHVYMYTFTDEVIPGVMMVYTYYYLAKFDLNDEIICLQCIEEDNCKYFLPLCFKHNVEELQKIFHTVLNFRYNLVY